MNWAAARFPVDALWAAFLLGACLGVAVQQWRIARMHKLQRQREARRQASLAELLNIHQGAVRLARAVEDEEQQPCLN